MSAAGRLAFAFASASLLGCASRPPEHVVGAPAGVLVARTVTAQDATPKAEPRMVPPEVYMRTYLQLFGGLVPRPSTNGASGAAGSGGVPVKNGVALVADEAKPVDVQKAARGAEGNALFDTWDDYVSALGFPDYGLDIPRQTQTNALMVATFERLGIALCDRAVLHDLAMLGTTKPAPAKAKDDKDADKKPGAKADPKKPNEKDAAKKDAAKVDKDAPTKDKDGKPPNASAPSGANPPESDGGVVPIAERVVFAFDPPPGGPAGQASLDEVAFAPRFDVLHRTFLGYPASLAPADRLPRYLALYRAIVKEHAQASPKSKLSPAQAGWAAICYGLVRHPEFHLY